MNSVANTFATEISSRSFLPNSISPFNDVQCVHTNTNKNTNTITNTNTNEITNYKYKYMNQKCLRRLYDT